MTAAEIFRNGDLAALVELNRRRASGEPSRRLEEEFERRFGAGSRLAVYGTLAPGRSNHHQVAGLAGEWISGLVVHGELLTLGWGKYAGFPGLRWSPEGPAVGVELFVSADLEAHWPRLDHFEGLDYERILVPLVDDGRVVEVANLYQVVRR